MIRVVQSGEDSNTLIEMHGSDEVSSPYRIPFYTRLTQFLLTLR